MAESSGHSTGRKRKATAATASPIVQLSSAGLCGCSECWKTAVWRSPSPAEKKPKQTAETSAQLDHERQVSNSFVYETGGLSEIYIWSLDGRYMYNFSDKLDLTIVDLLRKTYKLLIPQTEWYRGPDLMDVAVVGPYAILASIYIEDGRRNELHLLRLTNGGDDYERIHLHHTYDSDLSAFALVEVTGEGLEVKRMVLHSETCGSIVFLRVDVDQGRADVIDTAVYPFRHTREPAFVAHVSADGRQLLAIHEEAPHVLQVYSLAERKWTKHELDGLVGDNNDLFWYSFSPSGLIYAQGVGNDCEFLFRCDVEQKKWERVPVEARDINDVAFVVNPADGREDGVLICRTDEEEEPQDAHEQAAERFQLGRRMFWNPDSLLRQAFVAVRKLHEGVHVEEVIRELVEAAGMSSAVLQKKFFPSAYDGMPPIPVRFHQ